MQLRNQLCVLAFCTAATIGSAEANVTQDNFLMASTGDLVNLCSATEADPLYTAAVNFCQGFAVGVYRVLQEQDSARVRHPVLHPAAGPNPE
jgi:hypothetical protein